MEQGKSIIVDPKSLGKAAEAIETEAEAYKEAYGQLYQDVNAISGSKWDGVDNKAYVRQIGEFSDDFDNMYTEMMNYVTYLRETMKAYVNAQNQIKESASGLQKGAC